MWAQIPGIRDYAGAAWQIFTARASRGSTRDMAKWLALSALIVAADQLAKYVAVEGLAVGRPVQVTPFFNLTLVYNAGAAFSLLSDAPGWQRGLFIAIALIASVWIIWLLHKYPRERLFAVALSLVL